MILFTALLNMKEDFSRDEFGLMLKEWNDNHVHEENIVRAFQNWDFENWNRKFEDENLTLEIQEFILGDCVCVMYQNRKENTVWDTTYIMNFEHHKLFIQLQRNYSNTINLEKDDFSSPHFITELIDKGYVKDDGDLSVAYTPIVIDGDNAQLLKAVIFGEKKYELPVVYFSFRSDVQMKLLDVNRIAKRLKGVAHVMVQKDKPAQKSISEMCKRKNPFKGSACICWPDGAVESFDYDPDMITAQAFGNEIAQKVIFAFNQQQLDDDYKLEKVLNRLAEERIQTKREKFAKEQVKSSNERKLRESLQEQLDKAQKKIDELNVENMKLANQNLSLKARLEGAGGPLIFAGEEKDKFDGEIRELLLAVLKDSLQILNEKPRRRDVVLDVLKHNPTHGLLKNRRTYIKQVFKDNTSGKKVGKALEKVGFVQDRQNSHSVYYYYGDHRYGYTIASTPSDCKGGANDTKDIERMVL